MIDTQAIRNKILDLAMRGQLTEQLPEEGTAEELYQHIQVEKQTLIKAGKIKKEKPMPEIKDEDIPYEIPESWKWVRLRSICTKIVDGDHNPPKGVSYKTDYWMLSAKNINNNRLESLDQIRYLTREVFDIANQRTRIEPGDIFFTIVATLGRSCVYEGGYSICFQRSVAVLTTLVFNHYLKYYLDSNYIQHYMKLNSTGSAQVGFYLNQVEQLLIPIPPLAEQKRIVKKIKQIFSSLDTIDTLLAQYSDNLTTLKAKLMDAAIQGKLTKQLPEDGTAEELYQQIQADKQSLIKAGKIKKEKLLPEIEADEIPFEIPKNWKWCRIGEIFTLQSGKNIASGSIQDHPDSDNRYPCYGGNGLRGYVDRFNVNGMHALIGRQGALCGNINFASGKFYATEHAVVVYEYSGTNMQWAGLMLRTLNLNQYATSVAQPGLAVNKINKVLIPLPPVVEQKRIARKIEELQKIFYE